MSFLKKHTQTVLLYAVLFVLFTVGTFYDLDISEKLADVNNGFAGFLEIWAEPPSLLFVAFSFCMLGVCLFREGGKKNKYLSGVCSLSGGITAYITAYRTAEYYSEEFASRLTVKIALGALAVLIAVLFLFLISKIKQEKLLKMKKAMLTVITAALATLVIISAVKSLWGRVRYRELLEIGSLEGFMNWYEPAGKAISDGYKSFPSGHTSNASLLFTVYYMISALDQKKASVIKPFLIVWIGVVMLSRIMCGAHFLTDVCAGAMITGAIILTCKKIL